jgi:hypothetical protein
MYAPQIGMWSKNFNRYFLHWDRRDSYVLVACVLLLAAAGWGVGLVIRARGSERAWRVYQHLFVLTLGSGLLSLPPTLHHHHEGLMLGLWTALVAAVALIYFKRWSGVVRFAKSASLTFSVLSPLLLYQVLTYRTYDGADVEAGTKPAVQAPANARPVFIFLFDEWSYLHCLDRSGNIRASLPNLTKFASQSIHFANAQSEGGNTEDSVPRFFFQADDQFVVRQEKGYLKRPDGLAPSRTTPSIFQMARDKGYTTTARGFYLPLRFVLGDQVDDCDSIPHWSHMQTTADRMKNCLLQNLRYWPDPISRLYGSKVTEAIDLNQWKFASDKNHEDTLEVIDRCPANTFFYSHSPGVHPPWVFHADGSPRTFRSEDDPSHYDEQMVYVDRLLGELLKKLKKAGKYDNSTIIVLADHGWKYDKEPEIVSQPDWKYRVPLMIKWPGQQTGTVVRKRFSLIQLKPILEAALTGGTLAEVERIIEATPAPAPPEAYPPVREEPF